MSSKVCVLGAVFICAAAVVQAQAQDQAQTQFPSLGPASNTTILPAPADDCAGPVVCNHDGWFEHGLCYPNASPPDRGAFGEGFVAGPIQMECAVFWLTQIGNYLGQPSDIFVWHGGVSSPPGVVIWMSAGHVFDEVAMWPLVSQHFVPMSLALDGEFTVGIWTNTGPEECFWFIASDENGPGGHPWVFLASQGYPFGWNPPSIVWGVCQSLGIGYTWRPATPTQSPTWGGIKRLFE